MHINVTYIREKVESKSKINPYSQGQQNIWNIWNVQLQDYWEIRSLHLKNLLVNQRLE